MSGKKSSQVEQDVGQPLREIKQRGVLVTLQQTMNLDWYPREIYYIGLYEVVSLRRYSGSRDRQFWSSTVSIVNEKVRVDRGSGFRDIVVSFRNCNFIRRTLPDVKNRIA